MFNPKLVTLLLDGFMVSLNCVIIFSPVEALSSSTVTTFNVLLII